MYALMIIKEDDKKYCWNLTILLAIIYTAGRFTEAYIPK